MGMKAQVVLDRAACVAYHRRLTALLAGAASGHSLDEAAVVLSVTGGKDEDPDWQVHRWTEAEEAELLRRFRTPGDPLKFLIVTSRLGPRSMRPSER